jgi:YHS domain-containing protein
MFRLLLFVILILILYYVLHYLIKDMVPRRKDPPRERDAEELVQDPCCQVYLPKESALKVRISGKETYFCSRECVKKFLRRQDAPGQ